MGQSDGFPVTPDIRETQASVVKDASVGDGEWRRVLADLVAAMDRCDRVGSADPMTLLIHPPTSQSGEKE